MEISFCSHPNTNKVIATIFGTWHDSWAVVACAKCCCDMIISSWIRAKWNFHHIWIVMEKSLVKWVPVRLSVDARKWPIGLAIMSHKHKINLPIALETRSWHCNVYKSKSIDTFDGRHRHLMVDTITNDVHVKVCFVYSYAFHVSYCIRV